ncbi:hydrogenase formation protein HypD [candidate division KSB1 bacterium]|nr:hydrogenase formation protein HypD [candidate division KSB1 bacterium]
MKYVSEFRNVQAVHKILKDLHGITKHSWSIMEICGGQTHALLRYGIDELLPKKITLLHGPGCPVCVTPLEKIDKAIYIARQSDVIFCSFGDMLRVPGSHLDLLSAKAEGADVRIVYSPMDALKIAGENPHRRVVFFAVGFETTVPAIAMTVHRAATLKMKNFYLLVSHVLVPPAIRALLAAPDNRVQGFLAAGHVCTVMGYEEYIAISKEFKIPIVVTGFEPYDLAMGIFMCVRQLENGTFKTENEYTRAVARQGNVLAQDLMHRVFKVVDRKWRGIGVIPQSGLDLNEHYAEFDAETAFNVHLEVQEPEECISGLVLQGVKKPFECSEFAKRCTPDHPLGATMVSTEGACAAYYRYKMIDGDKK